MVEVLYDWNFVQSPLGLRNSIGCKIDNLKVSILQPIELRRPKGLRTKCEDYLQKAGLSANASCIFFTWKSYHGTNP